MAVLSVDLAFRRWSDLGLVVLERQPVQLASASEAIAALPPIAAEVARAEALSPNPLDAPIRCELIEWRDAGTVDANILAGRLNHLCTIRNIRVLMLDGPQAWKSTSNGLEHARVSERQLNTAAKTGLPGIVKPVTYRAFAEFCVDVYDGLCRRGWRRLETHDRPGALAERVLVESYPHAAWKSLGLRALPAKLRAGEDDIAAALAALKTVAPVMVDRLPSHDQLQAIVAGLPGLALEEQNADGAQIVGNPPRREDGHWREGFIVLPVPPKRGPSHVRWMN
jgi:hypothetical protein